MSHPPFRVSPVEGHPEMDAWITALNKVLEDVHEAVARLEGTGSADPVIARSLDLGGNAIKNVTQLEGPSAQNGYVRILPTRATLTRASEEHRLAGAETISRATLERSLDALGARINEIETLIERLRRTT